MNVNFESAAKAARTINGKAGTLWSSLVMYQQDFAGMDNVALKAQFKTDESEANAIFKMKIGENSTYRVVKGVIISAVEYGIALVRKDGKARGKSEVEADVKAAKGEKSAIEKFKATLNTAGLIEAKLDAGDVAVATGIVQQLYDRMFKRLADLPSQS